MVTNEVQRKQNPKTVSPEARNRLCRDYHANKVTVPLECLRLGRVRGTPASMLLVDTLSIEACRGHLSLPDESQLIT